MIYRKKDTVGAIRWTENNFEEVKNFLGEMDFDDESKILRNGAMRITTKHGYDVFASVITSSGNRTVLLFRAEQKNLKELMKKLIKITALICP